MIKLAFRNLSRRRLRTLLTVLGTAIAISFTVGILSLTEGFMLSLSRSMEERGEDLLVFSQEIEAHPMPYFEPYGVTFSHPLIEQLRSMDNVKAVYPVMAYNIGFMRQASLPVIGVLNGVTPGFLTDLRPYLVVKEGRLLQDEDEYGILVGAQIAESQKLSLGSKMEVRGKELEVIGILQPTRGLEDMMSYALFVTVQQLYQAGGEVTYAAVTVNDLGRVEETARGINGIPGLFADTVEGFSARMMDILGIARALHMSLSSIALLIGVLFIMTTMIMAVTERIRELGTMRAIGAGRAFVFRMILIESTGIGLLAGILGAFGGYLLSRVIAIVTSRAGLQYVINPAVTPRIIITGLVIAFLVGAIAGLYPAWRISRMNIVEALRHE